MVVRIGFLTTPSGFSTYNQIMIIAELNSRLVLIDDSDNFIEYLFMDEKAPNYVLLINRLGR
ncbi:MAG TPA: hypothetical protein DCF86_09495 [Dehalococcoidia bacterium]|nr:hypothetical protein [Dehalococcoidia bacterium]